MDRIEFKCVRVSEAERVKMEASLAERLGPMDGVKSGASPYSAECVIFHAFTYKTGMRLKIVPVCSSFDGDGHYKGRGRVRTVLAAMESDDGDLAICDIDAIGAKEVECSGWYVRDWAIEADEQSRGGLSAGASSALADAFAALGM
jgi:hypothetical protein